MNNNYEKFLQCMAEMIEKYGRDVLDEVRMQETTETED